MTCAVVTAFAAGCGEKEEPATTGPVVSGLTTVTTTTTTQEQGKSSGALEVVDDLLASPDAATFCTDEVTPSFLRKTYGSRKGCLTQRTPVSLTKRGYQTFVKPKRGPITAVTVKPNDGRYAGRMLQISVLRRGDEFRIASVKSSAKRP